MRLLPALALVALLGSAVGAQSSRRTVAASVELDHVYLWVRPGAPEATALQALGLTVADEPAHHNGNGTSSAAVMFENAYVELLYPDSAVSDSSLSALDRADRLRRVRWHESGASPIGIGLRRRTDAPNALPFPTQAMTAPWIRPGSEIRLVTTLADSLSPWVFVVPRYMALTGWIDDARREAKYAAWFVHPLRVHRVTHVRVVVTTPRGITPQLAQLNDEGVVVIATGSQPGVELTLDGGVRGAVRDLRPELPLIIRY